jgi:hypothetical protein
VAIKGVAQVNIITGAYPTSDPDTLGNTKVIACVGKDLDVHAVCTGGAADTIHILGYVSLTGWNQWQPYASFSIDPTAKGGHETSRTSPGRDMQQPAFTHFCLWRPAAVATGFSAMMHSHNGR